MIGFIIWSLFGVFIIGLGIKDMFSKNPVGFWANTAVRRPKYSIHSVVSYWCDGGNDCNYGCL